MSDHKTRKLNIRISDEEYDLLHQQMELVGTNNLSAFIRKIAIDGMIIKLNMPEIQELLSLLRRANANINQIAKHCNASGRLYQTDVLEIIDYQKEIQNSLNEILTSLSKIS